MTEPKNVSKYAHSVAQYLLNINAVQLNVQQPFKWASGIESPVYCDNRKINSNVEIRNAVVAAFVDLIESRYPDLEIVAGVATGGIPMGALIADRLKLPFIYVRQDRKEHGLMKQVEGDFKVGDKVVLIEDLISTGGSSLKAVKGLQDEGLELIALVSIMTYGFESARIAFESAGVAHYSLCDLDAIIDVALKNGNITATDRDAILQFRSSPKTWWQELIKIR